MEKMLSNFVNELKKVLGDNLRSFIVYGSAATGEHYKYSDYNTLIVLAKSEPQKLKSMTKAVKKWTAMRQPIPLIFTYESMIASGDIFPIEFLDIKENSIVLYGDDAFKKIKISPKNLRLEIERELKSQLLRLRQNYIMTGGNPKKIKFLLIRSISGVVAILKAIIRLYKKKAPSKKNEIIEAAPAQLKLNKKLFFDIIAMKGGFKDIENRDIEFVFASYLNELDKLADLIDRK
jgi:predicted nucleotidyltransferase